MNTKFFVVFAIALMCCVTGKAQNNADEIPSTPKATLLVDFIRPGYGISRHDYHCVDEMRVALAQGAAESGRVSVLDVNDIMELRTFSGENLNDFQYAKERYGIMAKNNVSYVVECDLNALGVHRNKDPKASELSAWIGEIGYVIRLISPVDGKTVATATHLTKDNTVTDKTPERAIASAISRAKHYLNRYVMDNFRVEGQILQLLTVKKDDAKTVAVNVGPANGAQKGTKFEVMQLSNVAGRTLTQKIGELKIKEIQGDDFSIGEVKKGGAEIKAALDRGEVLMINSTGAGFWD